MGHRSHGRMNARQRRAKLRRLLERDGVLHCWICGEKIERSLPPEDDWAISIDHVVRLADGGDHDISNLRQAHRACNTLRDRRHLAELANAA